jgi:hypothetical protein
VRAILKVALARFVIGHPGELIRTEGHGAVAREDRLLELLLR